MHCTFGLINGRHNKKWVTIVQEIKSNTIKGERGSCVARWTLVWLREQVKRAWGREKGVKKENASFGYQFYTRLIPPNFLLFSPYRSIFSGPCTRLISHSWTRDRHHLVINHFFLLLGLCCLLSLVSGCFIIILIAAFGSFLLKLINHVVDDLLFADTDKECMALVGAAVLLQFSHVGLLSFQYRQCTPLLLIFPLTRVYVSLPTYIQWRRIPFQSCLQ